MTEHNEGESYERDALNSRRLFSEDHGSSPAAGWLYQLVLIALKILIVFSMGAWFVMCLEEDRQVENDIEHKGLMMEVSDSQDADRLSELLAYTSLGESAMAWVLYQDFLDTPSQKSEAFRQAVNRLKGQALFKYLETNMVKAGSAEFTLTPTLTDQLDATAINSTMTCFKELGIYYKPEIYNPDLVIRSDLEKQLRAGLADFQRFLPTSAPPCRLTFAVKMDPSNA